MPEWSGITGLRRIITSKSDGKSISRIAHEFSAPDNPGVSLGDWSLSFVAGARTTSELYTRATIEQTIYACFDFRLPQCLDDILNTILRRVGNLLTLAVGKPTSLLELALVRDRRDSNKETIQALIPQDRYRLSAAPVSANDMNFTFNEIVHTWPDPLRLMCNASDYLSSAMDLYFSVVCSPGLFLEVQFLTLAQALESLHQDTYNVTVLPPASFDLLRSRIEDAICDPTVALDTNLRLFYTKKLSYWNEASLRHRIRDILRDLRPAAQAIVGADKLFVKKFVDTRNYLTHHDPGLRYVVSDKRHLFRLTQTLRFIVEQCLLRTIGISDLLIDRHTKRTQDVFTSTVLI